MNLYQAYHVDKQKAAEGVWINFESREPIRDESELTDCACVKLAPTSSENGPYRRMLNAKINRLRKGYRNAEKIPFDLQDKAMAETLVETVLLDWRNFSDKCGDPLPYSKEIALQTLLELPAFRVDLTELAEDMEFFRSEIEDDDIKN